ncbi:MAG: substrate-binding domain-containing protein [Magnetococcales bacterium]|nr:substrate-binding domain-containing protein [Magnetococcales bacterium]
MIKWVVIRWVAYSGFIGLLWLAGAAAWADDPIRISGTGAATSVMKQVVEAYRQRHPDVEVRFHLPPMGSSGAIKAVGLNQLDVALSGRPLKKEEESAGLVQQWLGRSPFLFVVHQDAPVSQISLDQLTEMYSGRQKAWPDGSRVRVILRPVADADTALLKSISPAMDEAVTYANSHRVHGSAMADTDIDLADMVEKVPGALGSVALTLVLAERRSLRGLVLDGSEPTVAALKSGHYPYAKPLFLVTRAAADAAVGGLTDFIRSATGQILLEQLGISITQP